MKKVLIICMILLSTILVKSQAVLEHTYPQSVIHGPSYTSSHGWVYTTYSSVAPWETMEIYDENHVLIKSIVVPFPSGFQPLWWFNTSDHLFNSDDKVEICFSILNYNTSQAHILVLNEDGIIIQTLEDQEWASIFETDGDFKMWTTGYESIPAAFVYDLPGTTVGLIQDTHVSPGTSVFPNPCSSSVTLSYPTSATWITISSMAGVELYKAPAGMGNQTIDIRSFPAGTYVFQVIFPNGRVHSGTIVVSR